MFPLFVRLAAAAVISTITGAVLVSSQAPQPAPPNPQRPTFRAGAHYVRVDAYPERDGRIVKGLTKDDFEILEDGKPQTIESLEFIEYPTWTPETMRRDPGSTREMLARAADPAYRVFVLYLDTYHVHVSGSHRTRRPLIEFLNRILGPKDLFGLLTPAQSADDLTLGQQTMVTEEQLTRYWHWGEQGASLSSDPEVEQLKMCFGSGSGGGPGVSLLERFYLDAVFTDLEELSTRLGGLREERKDLVLFSNGWTNLPTNGLKLLDQGTKGGRAIPKIGVGPDGRLRMGNPDNPHGFDYTWCDRELQRLAGMDFERRFRDLIALARLSNVTIHTITPAGLEAPTTGLSSEFDAINRRTDCLLELSNNTDGVAVVNTNDMRAGLRRIGDDVAASYVLGYYTTNSNWNGALRRITVRLKPGGEKVRARRQYQAPTQDEMAKISAGFAPRAEADAAVAAIDAALAPLARLRAPASMYVFGAAAADAVSIVVELGPAGVARWKLGGDLQMLVTDASGETIGSARAKLDPGTRAALVPVPVTVRADAPGAWQAMVRLRGEGLPSDEHSVPIARSTATLVGEPLLFGAAAGPASPARPVASQEFLRSERLRAEWPIVGQPDRREVRLLGRDGQPSPVAVAVTESTAGGTKILAADVTLAPLAPGDYLLELTAAAGEVVERRLVAFRVR